MMNQDNSRIINDINEIDLDSHTIIEASAGAGKTYFLENIVTRILLEKENIKASKLVVVTFTEKATSELQERVRLNLRNVLHNSNDELKQKKAKIALENFTKINISTIHGFCNKILNEYTFDSGMLLETKLLTDTSDITLKLLHSIIKKDWYEEFGDDMEWLVKNLENSYKDINSVEKIILSVAKKYNPQADNIQFEPDPDSDLISLINTVKNVTKDPLLLVTDMEIAKEKGIINELSLISTILIMQTAKKLRNKIDQYKLANGIISYDDMINIVAKNVRLNERLRKLLQENFQYGLVDEFQDTDAVQWEIFRQIFLKAGDRNKLFVIGDPKQSIYAFRNADIHSYFNAKNIILSPPFNGNFYTITKNWRSTSLLIDDFNKFFDGYQWEEHQFKPIEYSANSTNRKIIFPSGDHRNNVGLQLIKLNYNRHKSKRQQDYIQAIIKEIYYLLNNEVKIKKDKDELKTLNPNDICILVKARKEATDVEAKLQEAGLKASIYKKRNLYQTQEAINCNFLLQAIAYIDDISTIKRALLTEFFGIHLTKLYDFLSSDNFQKITEMVEKWRELAKEHLWAKFFNAIITDTGFLYKIIKTGDPGYERKITNYKHIFEILESIAHKQKFNIVDLAEYINDLVQDRAALQQDEDLHRLETEEPHITISTIHASKGLEFPIVFLFSFYSQKNIRKTDIMKYYRENKIVLDLQHEDKNKDLAKNEKLEESKRLLYVAMTRAIYKLYLPFYQSGENNKKVSLRGLAKDVNEKLKHNFSEKKDYIITQLGIDKNIQKTIDYRTTNFDNINDLTINDNIKKLNEKYNNSIFKEKKITVTSFSGLHYLIYDESEENIRQNSTTTFGDVAKEGDEIISQESMLDETSLPGGTETGLLLHSILEIIDFKEIALVKEAASIKFNKKIEKKIRIYFNTKNILDSKEQTKYRAQIKKIIYNTLTTPIMNDFPLASLSTEQRLHEVEFYMNIEDTALTKDKFFLMGFIDVVFIKDDKYYFIDWKSNVLDNYSGKEFKNSVNLHYKLQYQIYALACARWLEEYNIPIEKLGGFYYLYLRGMDRNNLQRGIFFIDINKSILQEYKNDVIQIVKRLKDE